MPEPTPPRASAIRRARLTVADGTRAFAHGVGTVARVGPVAIGRAYLEPGWRWSNDVQPIAGTAWCEIHHLHVLLAGRLGVELEDGERADFEAGDVFDLPPGHDAWVIGDELVDILDVSGSVGEFAMPPAHARIVATLLMTDIVDSTGTAVRLGDGRWRRLLADHDRIARIQLDRFRGHEVHTTGDGFLARFDSAAGAIRCAAAIRDAVAEMGILIRAGVHSGEIELLPDDVRGVAVHAAARVMALAGASEILVSSVTRALLTGSGVALEPRGSHVLKGIAEPMDVFAVV